MRDEGPIYILVYSYKKWETFGCGKLGLESECFGTVGLFYGNSI